MNYFAEVIGRVMMTAVNLPRSNKEKYADFKTWAETEYRNDKNYAYQCMIEGNPIDLR
jgi:hypothetical protein